MNETVEQIVGLIRSSARILVMGHIDPDGDAVGAVLALGQGLRRLGKQVVMACPNRPPSKYNFVPAVAEIVTRPQGAFDLFVSVDSSDTRRLADLYSLAAGSPSVPLVNIDHHVTNLHFGAVNWVDASAAATSEMIVTLLDALGVSMDRDLALPLLVGIVTDTRGFRTANTTPAVLRITARLIEAGVPLAEVMERTMNARPYAMMCLWGRMMATIHLDGRIAWAVLTPEMHQACGINEDGDGGFVNFLVTAREADVGVLFHDKGDGEIEVGFRAKPGVSVAEVALRLGGGGHPQASGCTIRGALDEVRQRVLSAVREAIAGQSPLYD
jgi:phosphoesterase RecJ-like protein